MKIVQIIPGSGDNFYCENCLRDMEMVHALRRLGHDVMVVPLYLPGLLPETQAMNTGQLFYGGINVYLQQKMALFRYTPRWLDRWLDSPTLLKWVARKASMTRASDLALTTVSMLQGEKGRQVKELNRLLDWLVQQEKPDVVTLSNALLVGLARRIKQRLGVPLVCFLQDEEEFLDAFDSSEKETAWQTLTERAMDVDMFVAPSDYCGEQMALRLRVEPRQMQIIRSGIKTEDFPPAQKPSAIPIIGFLSRLCADKGLDILVDAYVRLKRKQPFREVKLHLAGGKTSGDETFIQGIRKKLDACGVLEDVEFVERFDRNDRAAFLRNLTVLAVPERYNPCSGRYVLESLAAAVPVVTTAGGVMPEFEKIINAGIFLVPKDDPAALAQMLEPLLADPQDAYQQGRKARETILERFGIERTARELESLFSQLCLDFSARHKRQEH